MADATPPSKLLLVEGSTDCHVVWRLTEREAPELQFRIGQKRSVEQVLQVIRDEINVSGRVALGVLVDANGSWKNRWKAISSRLKSAGVDAPRIPRSSGVIIDNVPRKPRIGVWIMPDNQSNGELEDFIQKMIPVDDPVWLRSGQYIDGIPPADRKFRSKVTRAKVHAWLATRKEPRQPGLAIKTGDLRADGELAQRFVRWLDRLFR